MITRIRPTFAALKNNHGFTLMELCMVIAIIGLLATVAIANYTGSRRHMADAAALAEAQGLGKAVLNSFIEDNDVDLTHNIDGGRQIGALDNSGNARKPIFHLSPAMQVTIDGSSNWMGSGNGYVEATLEHPLGSKQYFIVIDEANAFTSFPDY